MVITAKNHTLLKFFVLLTFAGALFYSVSAQQLQTGPVPNGLDLEKLNRTIAEHEALLAKYPDNDFTPTALLQLAQLYQRQAHALFQERMEQYEQQLLAFERKERTAEPILPQIDLSRGILHLERLVQAYPQVAFRDKALYMLGMSYFQTGESAKAKVCFDTITRDFPQSAAATEAHFRIGEYYFDHRDYTHAITHYQKLLDQWDNAYFDMALYKLGWSYYNLSNYTHAISSFIYLLEDMALIDRTDSQQLSRSKADLSVEAIQYIASCYAEFGGPDAASAFFSSRAEKPYTQPILFKLAELYEKRGYYPEAVAARQVLLSIYPHHERAPDIMQQMTDNYKAGGPPDAVLQMQERIVDYFAPGSLWMLHQADTVVRARGDSLARFTLRLLAMHHQAQAQQNGHAPDYGKAIEKYAEYLRKYPQSRDAAEIEYLLAECHYAREDFPAAAAAYTNVLTRYDTTRYRHDAAYNRVLCHIQMLNHDGDAEIVPWRLPYFLGSSDTVTIAVSRPSQQALLQACNDFIVLFPDSKWHDQILMKMAETLHDMPVYALAARIYKQVVDLGSGRPYFLSAALNAGQSYFDDGRYVEADKWFERLITSFPDSVYYLERATRLSALSKYKIAAELSQSGPSQEAARLLTQVAGISSEPALRERAFFEAAAQHQKLNQWSQAAEVLEKLAGQQPPSALSDEALYRAAGFRETNLEWQKAAANYLLLCDRYPDSRYAMQALKNAALCFETIEDWAAARKARSRFVTLYPDSLVEWIECLARAGDLAYKADDWGEARRMFAQTVQAYQRHAQQRGDLDPYYAAQAQFMLGEMLFAEYAKLNLQPPFERALKRKVNKFNDVFQAYKSTLEYQIADWSTAASYRIGLSFEEFVRAFIESPPPAGLKGDALQAYQQKMIETAKPYKEQALATYEKTVEQAQNAAIENNWVEESRKRLQQLRSELGLSPAPAPADTLIDAEEKTPS